jgi:uncharacterized protein (TIGR02266 family)
MGKKSKKERAKAKRVERKPAEHETAQRNPAAPELVDGEALETVLLEVVDIASLPVAPLAVVDEELRASQRISIEVELHLASDSHFFSGLSGDISEGGVFVSTYRALAQGSLVDIEFSLPGSDRPLHARGEVRWHRDATADLPPGVGIAFDELSDDDRKLIQRFCTMRPALYYDDVG